MLRRVSLRLRTEGEFLVHVVDYELKVAMCPPSASVFQPLGQLGDEVPRASRDLVPCPLPFPRCTLQDAAVLKGKSRSVAVDGIVSAALLHMAAEQIPLAIGRKKRLQEDHTNGSCDPHAEGLTQEKKHEVGNPKAAGRHRKIPDTRYLLSTICSKTCGCSC